MFKQEIGFYLGREKPDGFSGFVDENNLFLTVEIETGITPDRGRELTAYIREKISVIKIENLQQFDVFISNIIKLNIDRSASSLDKNRSIIKKRL